MASTYLAPDKSPQPLSDLEVRAAWLYYVEGLTQERIARVMTISRAKVIRLLAAARDGGMVRVASGGRRKVGAIRAALEAIAVSVLISDEATAGGLLA